MDRGIAREIYVRYRERGINILVDKFRLKDIWLARQMAVWVDGCMGRWLYGQMAVWVDICIGRQLYGQIAVWLDGRIGKQLCYIDRKLDRYKFGRTKVERQIARLIDEGINRWFGKMIILSQILIK